MGEKRWSEFYVKKPYWMMFTMQTETWKNNSDCCSWDGISRDPKTGNVVELDLSLSYLNGPLRSNSSLFRLKHFQSLNLDSNNLTGFIPESIGDFKYLRVLNLHDCNLFGKIPSSVGNLSYLTHLVVSNNLFSGELPYSMSNLNRLTHMDLSFNMIGGNFPQMLLNFSELTHVNLDSNRFEGILPSNMSSLSKLVYFVMSGNSFSGSIAPSLFVIPSLIYLNLERNDFTGLIEIGNISSPSKLQELSLGENNLNGSVPKSISKLVNLRSLDLSFSNPRMDMVDLGILSHLILLDHLDLSGHDLKINPNLDLPSSIETLILSSCNIVEFPKFLQTQTNLSYLDISVNQIEGQVPEWLWKLPKLSYVNISQNIFSGFEGPADVIQRSDIYMLDISSNTFMDFPLLPKSTSIFLDLKIDFLERFLG